ncbi:hypothetical protein [Achromobacter kerstersii]|uniref:hypothetical protein n=1 Tax=Achromobacter kerstersii TaxID=1353890 RepID=UPI0006C8BF6E|nr:hypothetical protein [Achromobacter kerstersii]
MMRNKPHEEKQISQLAAKLLDAEIELGHESYIHSEYEGSEAVHLLQSFMRDPATIDDHQIETAARRANQLWSALGSTLSLSSPLPETLDAINRVISEEGQPDALTLVGLYVLSRSSVLHEVAIRQKIPNLTRARKGAEGKHGTEQEKKDKKQSLRERWAGGTYATRKDCAAQEYVDLGMTQTAAEKALWGTPDPDPWPAKSANRSKK